MGLYFLFAVIATGVNLGMQWLTLKVYGGPYPLLLAMAMGTGSGLVLKYVLDKKFVFDHKPKDLKGDAFTFVMYTAMGLVTTLIFWAVEYGFHTWIPTEWSKYLGATVGLAIGYITKYFLDKRFVFQNTQTAQ